VICIALAFILYIPQPRENGTAQEAAPPDSTAFSGGIWPALQATLRTLGDSSARSLTTLAQRLGVSEADAAAVVTPLEETPVPVAAWR
jgi:hypothetical protein